MWAVLFVLAGHSDLGSLSSYLVFVRQSAMPLNQLTQQGNFLLSALSGAERIFNLMDEAPEVDEGDITLVRVRPEADGNLTEVPERTGHYAWKCPEANGSRLVPLKGDVRFDHVTFSYVPGKPVLRDVSLFARPGETIAFVGSTGAGKTTIINLITRFYEIDSGTITYDGLDLRRIPQGRSAPQPVGCCAGHPSVHRHHRGQHPVRAAFRQRRGGTAGRGAGQRGFLHPPAAGRVQHPAVRRRGTT